jgi:hypothetical protein
VNAFLRTVGVAAIVPSTAEPTRAGVKSTPISEEETDEQPDDDHSQ